MGEAAAHRKPKRGTGGRRAAFGPQRSRSKSMAEHEREVIVTSGGGGGGTAIIAVVLLIAVLVVLFFLFGQNMMNGGDATDIKADIKVDTPATNN
jgi:uncharacterized membrane protein